MSTAYQVVEATEPTDFALREAIRAFTDEETERSSEAMLADFLVMLGRACARLDEGATVDEAVADLVFHGLDRESAESIVQKAGETVKANRSMVQDAGKAQPAGNWLTRFGLLVIVLLAVLVYMVAAS